MISSKLFAHIQNDLYLKGTQLEGMAFRDTIEYLWNFIAQARTNPSLNDLPLDNLNPLLEKVDFLHDNSLQQQALKPLFQSLNAKELLGQPKFQSYCANLVEKLKSLDPTDKQNNSFMIAGGWSNSPDDGHALIYEFKKDDNGDLLFIVHNSGDGLNYHLTIPGADKNRSYPVYVYRVPKNALDREDRLSWFFGELLIPSLSLNREAAFSAKRLYEDIFPQIAYLNGELEEPFAHAHPETITAGQTAGQHSGTCAEKVLHQLLKNALPNKACYKKFMYFFKKYALEQYLTQLETAHTFDKPGVLNQISKAFENMSRLLLKKDFIDEKTRKQESVFLDQVKQILQQHQVKEDLFSALNDTPPSYTATPQETVVTLQYPAPESSPTLVAETSDKTPLPLKPVLALNVQAKDLQAELSAFHQEVISLLALDPQAGLKSLQNLFITWPLTLEVVREEDQRQISLALSNLNKLYVAEYKKYHGDAITSLFFVSQLSFVAIESLINDKKVAEKSLLEISARAVDESLKDMIGNPFLGSENPLADARLAKLRQMLTPKPLPEKMPYLLKMTEKSANILAYYDAILKQNDLRALFGRFFEKFCALNRLSTTAVCSLEGSDVRPMLMMKHYLEGDQAKKAKFIDDLQKFDDLNPEQTEDLRQKLARAESQFLYQRDLENWIKDAWIPLRQLPMPTVSGAVIELNYNGFSIPPLTSNLVTALSKNSGLKSPETLALPKDGLIETILKNYQQSTNHIQICDFIPQQYAKTKDIKWIRAFLQLRSSSLMLPATADFFGHNAHFLEDEQNQLYFEKNLFDPILLGQALDDDPETIQALEEFFEFGMQTYSKADSLEMPALFFMKSEVKLTLYAIEHYQLRLKEATEGSPAHEALQMNLKHLHDKLFKTLNRANKLSEIHAENPSIVHKLALQQSMMLSFLSTDTSSLNEKQALFPALVSALLALRYYEKKSAIGNLLEKEKLSEGLRVLQSSFNALAEKDKAAAEQLLIQSISDFVASKNADFKTKLANGQLSFHLELPVLRVLDGQSELLSINLNQGLILRPGLNNTWLPDEIRALPVYRGLLKELDPPALSNLDNTYYEFEQAGIKYRVLKIKQQYVLQKQISVFNQQPAWYQAAKNTDIAKLQKALKEDTQTAWIQVSDDKNSKPQVLLADQTGALTYCYQGESQALIKLNPLGQDSGYRVLDQSSTLHQLFAQFEDPKFIIVLKGPLGYRVQFPRYELSFDAQKAVVNGQDTWEIKGLSFIPDMPEALVINSDKGQKVILPMQQYMVEADINPKPKVCSEYYHFIPNTADYLREDQFGAQYLFGACQGTEKTAEYVLKKGQLLPLCMADGLYLAYVYLCRQQPEKAFQTLQYCEQNFHNLSGSPVEMDIIIWMIKATPAQLRDSKLKAKIETPECLAVQLKALNLLANFKNQNPNFKLPPAIETPPNTLRQLVETNLAETRKSFYRELDEHIYELFYKYQHANQNVPDTLLLSDQACLNQLRLVYAKKKPVAGPVGVAWRRLEVKNLILELQGLENKAKQYAQDVPSALLNDIERVKAALAKQKSVLSPSTTMKTLDIDLTLPRRYVWQFESLSHKNVKAINDWYEANHPKSRDLNVNLLLEFPIDEEEFILSFPLLCEKMYYGSLSVKDKSTILTFCEQSMRANALTQKASANLPQLCQFLYVLGTRQEKLSALIRKSRIESLDEASALKFEPANTINNLDGWMQNLASLLSNLPVSTEVALKQVVADEPKELTNTRLMASDMQAQEKPHTAIPLKAFNNDDFSVQAVLSHDKDLLAFFDELAALTETYQARRANIIEWYKAINQDDFMTASQQSAELDNEAGALANTFEENKNHLFLKHLGSVDNRSQILKMASSAKSSLKKLSSLQREILETFANQNLEKTPTTDSERELQLGRLGRNYHVLTLPDLLALYLRNDLEQTKKVTGLAEGQVKELHDMVTEYLAYSIQQQQYQRICGIFEEGENDEVDLNKLGQAIAEKNVLPHGSSPALMLFQYDQDLLIRDVQKQFMDSLLTRDAQSQNFTNKIVQLIMGGGKSKVLLPLLALQRADGENLSVIEVPKALFKTNAADLNQVTLRLFNQPSFNFEFNRDSACDALTLKSLYKQLKNVSVNKQYMLTTKESMDSLDLKYHELLSNKNADNKGEWSKQVKWLDRILNFVKSKGDVLIDEMDSSLYIREQFNYTLGNPSSLPSSQVNAVIDLFKFLDTLQYEGANVLNRLLNTEALSKPLLNQLLEKVADELVHNKKSPLFPFLPKELSETEANAVVAYLLNRSNTVPNCVTAKDTLIGPFTFKFLKGELCHLLPHTLKLKLFENYGPSKNPKKSMLEKLITIPYAGNTEPRERSKDTNPIKTLNLTVQGTLETGLSPQALEYIVTETFKDAKAELMKDPKLVSIDNTSYGKKMNTALRDAGIFEPLSAINPKDTRQMAGMVQKLQGNRNFIFYALKEHIFPLMEVDTQMLMHNSSNHISMYRSVQGMTGTPWNWRTMQSIAFDELQSLGTDGLTISRLEAKNPDGCYKTQVHTLDYLQPLQFIQQAVLKLSTPKNFRALIDIGATFRGVANYQVALKLAAYAKEHNASYQTNLKYVLYFDKEAVSNMDELFAMRVDDPLGPPMSLKGKTAKDIKSLLNCSEDDYLSYYDQKHTVGADIKQAVAAEAIVTIDQKTLKKDLCQGIMRMRGFGQGQHASIFLSKETKQVISHTKEQIDIKDVIRLTEQNQINALLQDQFLAAMQMMEDTVSRNLKSRILNLDAKAGTEKAALHACFAEFFTQSLTEQFIDSYGRIEQWQATKVLLKAKRQHLLQDWLTVLHEAKLDPNQEDILCLQSQLKSIQKKALSYCAKAYLQAPDSLNQTSQTQTQKQMQNRKEMTNNQHLDSDESSYKAQDRPAQFWPVLEKPLDQLLNLKDEDMFITSWWDAGRNTPVPISYAMPVFCEVPKGIRGYDKSPLATSNFDASLRRSYNFVHTGNYDADHYFEATLQKQAHAVMMIQKDGELKVVLITFKEAEYIKQVLKEKQPEAPNYIWITNPNNSHFAGKRPPTEALNKNHDRIMQQIQFYNGDLSLLSQSDLSGTWLMEGFAEKLHYFEEHLLPYRMTDKQQFMTLKKDIQSLDLALKQVADPGCVSGVEAPKLFNELDYKHRYPSLNAANLSTLAQFHEFCQKLLWQGFAGSIPEAFAQAYYFELMAKTENKQLAAAYFSLFDETLLPKRLVAHFELLALRGDFNSLNTLMSQAPFDGSKNTALVEALKQSFANPVFVEKLIGQGATETLHRFFSLLSPTERQVLIRSMSTEDWTQFLASSDLNLIKALCDGVAAPVFDEKTKPATYIRIQKNTYDYESSYDYLLRNPEKLHYLQTHASPVYLKAFWGNMGGYTNPWCELFEVACTSADVLLDNSLFQEVYTLMKDDISPDLCKKLWGTARKLIESDNKLNQDPLAWLAKKLSPASWFAYLTSEPNFFFKQLTGEHADAFIDLFYQQLMTIDSEQERARMLLVTLPDGYGEFYGQSLGTILPKLKPTKTSGLLNDLYDRSVLLYAAGKLAEKNHNTENILAKTLSKYSAEYLKRPQELTPLSALRLESKDPNSPKIVDIIRDIGFQSTKVVLQQALDAEKGLVEVPEAATMHC